MVNLLNKVVLEFYLNGGDWYINYYNFGDRC